MPFRPNPAFEAQLFRDPVFRAGLERIGKEMEAEAKRLARAEYYESGAYANSIEGGVGEVDGRAVARVVAKDFKALWAEFGTAKQPARAILRRAAESAGVRVDSRRR